MPITEYQRDRAAEQMREARKRARAVPDAYRMAYQGVLDARAQYLGMESYLVGQSIPQADVDAEYRAGFAADVGTEITQGAPFLIAAFAEISRMSGVTARAHLQAIATAAPDQIPTDSDNVVIGGDGSVSIVAQA